MSKIKKTTLAIVGRGHWGSVYIKTIKALKNVLLPDENILGKDYKDKLTKKKVRLIDGVIIASPTPTHFEVSKYLIKNGFFNLLIEKPLTHNLSAALKLQKLQKSALPGTMMVGHIQLYDPAYIVIKQFIKKLGKINQINYTSLKGPPIPDSTVLKDSSPHPLYIFLDIANSKPKKIIAKKGVYDNLELTVEFENKILGTAKIGSIYPKRVREIEVIGEGGKLKLNEFINPRELVFYDKAGKAENLSFPLKNPLEEQILEFIDCIKTKRESKTPISQGVDVMKLIDKAEESLKKGKVIIIP